VMSRTSDSDIFYTRLYWHYNGNCEIQAEETNGLCSPAKQRNETRAHSFRILKLYGFYCRVLARATLGNQLLFRRVAGHLRRRLTRLARPCSR
jgi:hypothetical protein